MTTPLTTPLYQHHQQLGARMIAFGDWLMPVQYSGTIAEHTAVREAAGLFDVSHMGEFSFRGPGTLHCLQRLTANDVSLLHDGQAQYSFLLNDRGGIVDDIIVYRYAADHCVMVVNAGNLERDWHWVMAHQVGDVSVTNDSAVTALIALQGPQSDAILRPLVASSIDTLKRFHFLSTHISGIPVVIARTGYTGSPGVEIFVGAEQAGILWSALLESGQPQGLIPCGLAARDTLRLEMAYPLHGHEITDKTTPWEAGLGWVVKLAKGEFTGREALQAQQQRGVDRQLVGFRMIDRGIARDGYPMIVGHKPIGYVTSGTISPTLKIGIGLGYVPTVFAALGTKFSVDIRGSERIAEVVATPFYRPGAPA